MGRVIVKARLWNIANEEQVRSGQVQPLEVDALIDTGAVRVVLPQAIADHLGLMRSGKVKVRYADERREEREVAVGLRIEIMDRDTEATAIIEPARMDVLVGQIVLEDLDLHVDCKNARLIPNPESPDAPLIDLI